MPCSSSRRSRSSPCLSVPRFPSRRMRTSGTAWTDYRLWLARRMAIQGLDLALQGVHDPMILGLIRLVDELARRA